MTREIRFAASLVIALFLCLTFASQLLADGAAAPLSIIGHDPSANEVGVPLIPNINATFDDDVNVATIGNNSFVVHGNMGGLAPGSFTYNNDRRNSSNRLRQRRMIAALWDDLRTDTIYGICDDPGVYVDSYADHVLIDWEAYRRGAFGLNAAALFQVTLFRNGDILLSRGAAVNDWLIEETVGVSRGSGGFYTDITGESQPDRSWLLAMRKYVEPEPTAEIGEEETASPTSVIYWKEE